MGLLVLFHNNLQQLSYYAESSDRLRFKVNKDGGETVAKSSAVGR